ncbi:MAG: SGNH/GDSL hydrolase family protein [Candidatus Eisenbacteria bacterium]|uniref:SGNH/GDSL hydrolase family protein n=1 Tax=Eiseniibacteriota bacterium TaxID=2212470 RepID=A0A956RQL4_UNCEI|nr:SGNH/GDSL hydrolase family protein [Candidatus Eisenbacteria bacterium]
MRLARLGRRLSINLALLCATLLAVLVLAEIAVRVAGYEGEQERLESVFDPKFGTVQKDSWIFDFRVDPSQPTITIHDQTFPTHNDPGTTRILFVGDSGTEGAYVPPDAAFPAVYRKLLESSHPERPVEVINAGVWGMTTIDEYVFFRDRLAALQPDVVILGIFMANDINFNLGHQERERRGGHGSWRSFLRQHSALAHLVYLRTMALNSRFRFWTSDSDALGTLVPKEMRLVDSNGFQMLNYPVGETATYMKQPSDLIEHAFRILDRVLIDFRDLGVRSSFRFEVVILPTPSTIAGQLTMLHFIPDSYGPLTYYGLHVEPDQLDFDLPTQRVHRICRERGIPCIDPTERMRPHGLAVFQPEDEHLSVLGHELVAEELLATRPE